MTARQTDAATRQTRQVERERLARALLDGVRTRLAGGSARGSADPAAVTNGVRELAAERGLVLGVEDLRAVSDLVRESLWGLGELAPLLRDPAVTDVLVNGAGAVYVDRDGRLERRAVELGGEPGVRALAVRLAAVAGRRLDDASPWVDARLPGGLRLHAVLPAVAPGGTHVSIRRIRPAHLSFGALVADGAMPAAWAVVVAALIRARRSFLISGGTGAGKTTLLGAMLGLVDPAERVVLVEDVAELTPDHPHVVRLEARPANVEGRGAVGLQDLVRQALRMRPDRLIVGECRGAEVRELLAALNTGHTGSGGTVHANTAAEVPARIEALGALAGMSAAAIMTQFAAAVDVVLHVERQGRRRVLAEVAVVDRAGDGRVVVRPALTRQPEAPEGTADPGEGPGRRGPGWERLRALLDGGGGPVVAG